MLNFGISKGMWKRAKQYFSKCSPPSWSVNNLSVLEKRRILHQSVHQPHHHPHCWYDFYILSQWREQCFNLSSGTRSLPHCGSVTNNSQISILSRYSCYQFKGGKEMKWGKEIEMGEKNRNNKWRYLKLVQVY